MRTATPEEAKFIAKAERLLKKKKAAKSRSLLMRGRLRNLEEAYRRAETNPNVLSHHKDDDTYVAKCAKQLIKELAKDFL